MKEPEIKREYIEKDGDLYKLVTVGNQTLVFRRVILAHWKKLGVYDHIEGSWEP